MATTHKGGITVSPCLTCRYRKPYNAFRHEITRFAKVLKPVDVKPLPDYTLRVRYADGVEGEVDLSHLVGKGVFALWNDATAFEKVSIGKSGEIRWNEEVELCPDSLYLEITGKSPEEVFPNLEQITK